MRRTAHRREIFAISTPHPQVGRGLTRPNMISWSDISSYSSSTGFARVPFWGRGTSGQQFLSIRSFLGVPSTGELRGELAPELEHDEHRLSGREGPPSGNTSLRKKNFCVCSALRFCARAMFSSTFRTRKSMLVPAYQESRI